MPAVWILLVSLAILLALLAVPVELGFSVKRHGGRQTATGSVGWLFGLVRLPLAKSGARRQVGPEPGKKKRRQSRAGGARSILAMMRVEGFAGRLLGLARDLLVRIHVRELNLRVRLGLDDPADTGRLWAAVGPLGALLALPPVARLTLEPDFTAETFEFAGKGLIRIVPVQLLFVMLVFLLSPGTLRALRTMRAGGR